jgi:integrase
MQLTDLACKNAKPAARAYKLRDGKGLYLLVLPSGGKSFRYDFKAKRPEGGYRNGTHVLGLYPALSLAEARAAHAAAHKLVAQGLDPNAHRKGARRREQEAQALTFGAVTAEWLDKRRGEVGARTLHGIEKRLAVDVLPGIGDIPLRDLTPPAVLAMLRRIEARGAYEVAARARQACSQILRYAVATGRAERDVTADLRDALAVRKTAHQPALSPAEIPEFLVALERNDARLFPQTRAALTMLMLTFVRPAELAAARWDEVDWDARRWVIPAAKMKMGADHIVPLARQTLDILRDMQRLGPAGSPFVFPKSTDPRAPMARDTLSKAVRALGFQGRHSAHGFRALARTAIREKLGWDSEVIERQLAHAPRGSLGRAYDRTQFLEQRTTMMQDWADYLSEETLVGGF